MVYKATVVEMLAKFRSKQLDMIGNPRIRIIYIFRYYIEKITRDFLNR